MTTPVKVAVVGSGLAGLTAAYLLSKELKGHAARYEVHIFEKASSLGMDAHSVSLSPEGVGEEWRVDVPMRSFQGGYYPRLMTLYKNLGVTFRKSDFSYSFSVAAPTISGCYTIVSSMIYNGASGLRGVSMTSAMKAQYQETKEMLPRLLMQLFTFTLFALSTLQLLYNYVRLVLLSAPVLRSRQTPYMTFHEWAQYSAPSGSLARLIGMDAAWLEFLGSVVTPLFSAVCTASEHDIMQHPVEEFLDYIWLTLFTHHYVVNNGVHDVVKRLSAPLENVHVSSTITGIRPDSSDPSLVTLEWADAQGSKHTYDGFSHIIFATQANHASELLSGYLSNLPRNSTHSEFVRQQVQCLKTFTYKPTIVINHTDDSLLPENPSDRRDLNLIRMSDDASRSKPLSPSSEPGSLCVSPSYTMATHRLRKPSNADSRASAVFQTTNPIVSPREESVLSIAKMERAILTLDAKKALQDLYIADQHPQVPGGQTSLGSGRLGRLQGTPRHGEREVPGIWLCGSYAYQGIPLLEGCVVSAANVVEQGILMRDSTSSSI